MSKFKIKVNISYSWWLPIYLNTLEFLCVSHNLEPNLEEGSKLIKKAIKIKLVKEKINAKL